ncbi:MAG: hypothetical protein H6574_16935 [Lewinellaceae bacterium]|nr:hypothetical protein [Saprospiraceae bacterium]MCB9332759.1 hypothetical protein [Lewinellaceae bacterium]
MPTSATPVVPSVITRTHEAIHANQLPVGQEPVIYWLELDDGGRLVLFEYALGGSPLPPPKYLGEFNGSELAAMLRNQEALLISTAFNPSHKSVALPISLFSAPLGFLVMQFEKQLAANPMRHLFSYYSTLFNIAHECLEETLQQAFDAATLLNIGTVSDLRDAYCALVSKWLNPCRHTYQTAGEELEGNGHTTDAFGEQACALRIRLSYGFSAIDAVFELSSFRLTEAGQMFHEDAGFAKLTRRCSRKLSKLFTRLAEEWNRCWIDHHRKIAAEVAQLNALRNRLRAAFDDTTAHQLIREVPEPEQPPVPPPKPAFAWYKDMNENWIIRFAGKTIALNHGYKQGMVAIHQLLSNPNERIEWQELYLVLRQSGVTYDDTDDLARIDPDKVRMDYQTLKEDLAFLKQHRLDPGTPAEHQLAYWLKYYAIANALTTHNWHEWRQERARALKKLKELNWPHKATPLTLEMIFETYENLKRFRFDNNKTESIRKGIRSAISAYEQFPPLHEYLSQTLILTRKPFSFDPERCADPDLRTIRWQTYAV